MLCLLYTLSLYIYIYISGCFISAVDLAIKNLKARGETKLAAKAAQVAKGKSVFLYIPLPYYSTGGMMLVSTFIWISEFAAVDSIATYLRDAQIKQLTTGRKQGMVLLPPGMATAIYLLHFPNP
jgi:hypothetical protein